jgi:hypothetical protein
VKGLVMKSMGGRGLDCRSVGKDKVASAGVGFPPAAYASGSSINKLVDNQHARDYAFSRMMRLFPPHGTPGQAGQGAATGLTLCHLKNRSR